MTKVRRCESEHSPSTMNTMKLGGFELELASATNDSSDSKIIISLHTERFIYLSSAHSTRTHSVQAVLF